MEASFYLLHGLFNRDLRMPEAGVFPIISTHTVSSQPPPAITFTEDVTYSGRVNSDGTLTELQAFADRGGESVAVDRKGNVYIANGQVFVYDPSGRAIGRIDVPERPIGLAFGGPGGRTLFIVSHHSLYSAEMQ
jgi:hypothetical protein